MSARFPLMVDRYLVRETVTPFVGVLLALAALFLTFSLTRFLTKANDGLLSGAAVTALTALKVLISLEVLLPIALYIAFIVALGRLYADSEMVALRAGGMGEARLILPVTSVAIGVAAVVAALSLFARPWAYDMLYDLQARAEQQTSINELAVGQFHGFGDSERMVYLQSRLPTGDTGTVGQPDIAPSRLEGLFVRSRDPTGKLEVISAAAGTWQEDADPSSDRLALDRATIYKQVDDRIALVGAFDQFAIWIPKEPLEPTRSRVKAESTGDLVRKIDPESRAEFQWRCSTAVSTLLLALIAIPLARTRPRRGGYGKVLIAIILYIGYFNLLGIARSWVEQDQVRQLWWVPGLLALVIVGAFLLPTRSGR